MQIKTHELVRKIRKEDHKSEDQELLQIMQGHKIQSQPGAVKYKLLQKMGTESCFCIPQARKAYLRVANTY